MHFVTDDGGSAPNPPNRLLLVSIPRTASNLLLKVLALPDQPNALTNHRGGYFCWDLFMNSNNDGRMYKPLDQWTAEDTAKLQQDSQQCFNQLEEYSARAMREGKMFVTKEHVTWLLKVSAIQRALHGEDKVVDRPPCTLDMPDSYGASRTYSPNNQTIFPDEYLRTWKMAFIIRHPALVFASLYRAMNKLVAIHMDPQILQRIIAVDMTLRWTRLMFDLCTELGNTPVLLDAHDLINNPKVVARFCERIGLDPTKLRFEWETDKRDVRGESEGERRRQEKEAVMLGTLRGSSGVIKEKAPDNVDLAVEVEKWKAEFGEEIAAKMEKAVQAAMPDYEYLTARRVTVDDDAAVNGELR